MPSGTSSVDEDQSKEIGLAEVNTLRRAGLISAGQYLDVVYRCREPEYWTRWALRALLALGVGHLLAGVIFFFALTNAPQVKPVLCSFGHLRPRIKPGRS